jgi:hypothetical protein
MLGSSFTTSNCWCMASTQKARRAFSQAGTPMDVGSATGIIVKDLKIG